MQSVSNYIQKQILQVCVVRGFCARYQLTCAADHCVFSNLPTFVKWNVQRTPVVQSVQGMQKVKWLIHALSQHVNKTIYSARQCKVVSLLPSTTIYLYRHVHRHRLGTTYTACGVNKNAECLVPSDTHCGWHITLSSFLSSSCHIWCKMHSK